MGHDMTELRINYKRDMQNSYLIIGTEAPCVTTYQLFMLLNNRIEGILPIELRSVDDRNEYYYKISSMQTFSGLYEKGKLGLKELITIVSDIIQIVNRGKEYLLLEEDFLLSPDYIYLTIPDCRISLCYLPGYHVSMAEQMSSFLEVLMNKVDYKDEEAVLLVYSMYMAGREEGCTFDTLLGLIKERTENPAEETRRTEEKLTEERNTEDGKAEDKETFRGLRTAGNDIGESAGTPGSGQIADFHNPFLRMPSGEKMKRIAVGCALLILAAGVLIWGIAGKVLYRFPGNSPDLFRTALFGIFLTILAGSGGRMMYLAFHQKKIVIKPLNFSEEESREAYCETEETVLPKEDMQAWDTSEGSTVLLADFCQRECYLVPAGCHTDDRTRLDEFPFFIGKWKDHVNLVIDDCSVSRFHARIMKEGEEYFITDLNSTNGTFLNCVRLEPNGTKKLAPGDEIAFAGRKYEFILM